MAPTNDQLWSATWGVLRDVMHPYILYLDTYERDVLMFIFLRTRLYRKEWEGISLRHFKYGIATAAGGYVIAPLDMGEPKILECLKHIEGKGLIDVRRFPGTPNPNQYRIKLETEIDRNKVFAYMKQHQKKLNQRMIAKFAQNRGMQAVIMGVPTPQSLGGVPHNNGEGLPHNYGDHNSPILNNPISNSAPSAQEVLVPVRLRKIVINKK